MAKVVVVCGYGPGISDAVGKRFGREGFDLALVARNGERLTTATAAFARAGIRADAFPCDVGDTTAVRAMLAKVRSELGDVSVIHWNAAHGGAGDLLAASEAELDEVLRVSIH